MDRISDSGSDGCGSIPHGGTRTGRIDATCSCTPSHFVTAPLGHAVTSFGRSGRPIRLSIFCGQNTRPGRAPDGAVASLRIIPQSLRDSPWGHAVTSFGRSGRPIRLSVFCGQNTRPGRAPDGAVASLRIIPQSLRDSPLGACRHFRWSFRATFRYFTGKIPGSAENPGC